MQETKDSIISLLKETNREGIDGLLGYLITKGFFESPASHKYHGAFKGGLAAHSLRVYELLMFHSGMRLADVLTPGQRPLPITYENIVIAPLLHDVCKIGVYVGGNGHYSYSKPRQKGHAVLSIDRVKRFITLEPIEEMMIRFHMGVYHTNEFDPKTGEYPLRGESGRSSAERYGASLANAWFHNPVCKLMSICDELATMEEKAKGV